MELADYLDHLHADGIRLADAAQPSSLDAAVPTCPGWALRDLVTHVGGIHRWAAAIVGKALIENEDPAGAEVGTGPDDAVLLDWFRGGHRTLVETLRAAPSDLQCFTFLPALSPLLFWARRQAHETAIHRFDAQSASGATSAIAPFDPAFALDGIDEMLSGFAARRRPPIPPGTMLLKTDDASHAWLVTYGDHGLATATSQADTAADVTVRGDASDLYLWLWNRSSKANVAGDESVASRWRDVRVRWS